MKFIIVRASDYLDDCACPVDGAFKDGDEWFIEINTLEDLLALREKAHDDLILGRDSIWTYDDRIE